MPHRPATPTLRLEHLEDRENPSAVALPVDNFDASPASLSAAWARFATDANAIVAAGGAAQSVSNSSKTAAVAWAKHAVSADTGAAASVFADSLVPAVVLARGKNLDTNSPSYLAAVVTRGLTVELWQVTDGKVKVVASVGSAGWLSGKWVRVTVTPVGDTATVRVVRQDTGEYLSAKGAWQKVAADAITAKVDASTADGYVGFGRAARYAGTVKVDDFAAVAPPAATPAPAPTPVGVSQTFDGTAVGSAPAGWKNWTSETAAAFGVAAARSGDAVDPTNGYVATAKVSSTVARSWADTDFPAASEASAAVYLDGLIPATVFVRGSKLDTAAASYYGVTVTRGLEASIVRVTDGGKPQVLGTVKTQGYLSNLWVRVRIVADGGTLRAMVSRADTGQYLTADGGWADAAQFALSVTDTTIAGGGKAGVARPASYAGAVRFDDFAARALGDQTPPTVTAAASGTSGVVTMTATAKAGAATVVRVEFVLDGVVRAASPAASGSWTFDTTSLPNGNHAVAVRAYAADGNVGAANVTLAVNNPVAAPLPVPDAPQHYDHIRIAQLAYSGNPMGDFEKALLKTSVDLVIPNVRYLAAINAVAPDTPQMVYSNISNLYQGLLTDWLAYADAHGISREDAFYHVTQPTQFRGSSPSSQPVTWFWSVYQTAVAAGGKTVDLTNTAHAGGNSAINWGAAGQSLAIGSVDPFREVNVTVTKAAGANWGGQWEYATLDAAGNVVWAKLNTLSDGTAGMTRTGTITFDPPAGWQATAAPGSSTAYFYVRFRVTSGDAGAAPVTSFVLGRDYVGANGISFGTIPAFDYAADKDGDGYLTDAEYAGRTAGKNARFVSETRLFYGDYGQMRFATNPANVGVRQWAADYHVRLLAANPLADGLFLDNSTGRLPFSAALPVLEPTGAFGDDYGSLVAAVNRAVSPKWVMVNTFNGPTTAGPTAAASTAALEEFILRGMAATAAEVDGTAALVKTRLTVDGVPYLILDSNMNAGGSATDGRTQLATLAYYYLVADPERTFLMLNGGASPASSWTQHWTQAAAVDVGRPRGAMAVIDRGTDPTNAALAYSVYGREYENGIVLYKPLSSSADGKTVGGTATATQTRIDLPGQYRIVAADGSVGRVPVSSVWLRNGEGLVLVKA